MAKLTDGDKKIAAIVVAVTCVLLTVAFSSGYFYRDHELMSNTVTKRNVKVLRKDSDRSYLMELSSGQKWQFNICPEYVPSFQPGTMLSLLKYEDMGNCKSLSPSAKMGFTVLRDENGRRIKEDVSYAREARARQEAGRTEAQGR